MSITLDGKKYGRLLAKHLPRVIESDAEQDRWIETLLELRGHASPESAALATLVSQLVEEYERRSVEGKAGRLPPVEMLRFLMEENGLKQADLLDVFGSRSVVSEVLSERRRINLGQARRLADRFRVAADLFV